MGYSAGWRTSSTGYANHSDIDMHNLHVQEVGEERKLNLGTQVGSRYTTSLAGASYGNNYDKDGKTVNLPHRVSIIADYIIRSGGERTALCDVLTFRDSNRHAVEYRGKRYFERNGEIHVRTF